MTGEERYWTAAKHAADLLAAKCNLRPGNPPWRRYADEGESPWGRTPAGNLLTGGVANILILLDEVIRLGYTGQDQAIVKARDAGRAYLRDVLLPAWTANDTWGRHYWDWEHPVQGILPTGWVAQYLMDHPDVFPTWKHDVRNLLSLYLNRACVSPASNGDVYSGAWAYPEGCACCGRSLDICPVFLGRFWARYAEEARSAWAREIVRRKTILSFYHFHDTGMVEDNIDGGQITAREWSEQIGFGPILCGLEILAWLPDVFGAREGEPHREKFECCPLRRLRQGAYRVFDLRMRRPRVWTYSGWRFAPVWLPRRARPSICATDLRGSGYIARGLACGDWIVTIRHDGHPVDRGCR